MAAEEVLEQLQEEEVVPLHEDRDWVPLPGSFREKGREGQHDLEDACGRQLCDQVILHTEVDRTKVANSRMLCDTTATLAQACAYSVECAVQWNGLAGTL